MPQLNPSPWLFILVTTWLVFLAVVPFKISNNAFTNDPPPINTKSLKMGTWNWPWH